MLIGAEEVQGGTSKNNRTCSVKSLAFRVRARPVAFVDDSDPMATVKRFALKKKLRGAQRKRGRVL